MTYSYTQISQYLSCPRRYRHRCLDGWQEKDTRAAMLFGRAFEQAVAALFRREDPAAVLFEKWGMCKDMGLTYSGNDTWDRINYPKLTKIIRLVFLTVADLANTPQKIPFTPSGNTPRP